MLFDEALQTYRRAKMFGFNGVAAPKIEAAGFIGVIFWACWSGKKCQCRDGRERRPRYAEWQDCGRRDITSGACLVPLTEHGIPELGKQHAGNTLYRRRVRVTGGGSTRTVIETKAEHTTA